MTPRQRALWIAAHVPGIDGAVGLIEREIVEAVDAARADIEAAERRASDAEDMCSGLRAQLEEMGNAVAEEREACAALANAEADTRELDGYNAAEAIATAIRARK